MMLDSRLHLVNILSALSDQSASPTMLHTVDTKSDLDSGVILVSSSRYAVNLVIPSSVLPLANLSFSLLPASVSSWPSTDSVAKEVLLLKPYWIQRMILFEYFLISPVEVELSWYWVGVAVEKRSCSWSRWLMFRCSHISQDSESSRPVVIIWSYKLDNCLFSQRRSETEIKYAGKCFVNIFIMWSNRPL